MDWFNKIVDELAPLMPRCGASLGVFVAFWLAGRGSARIVHRLLGRHHIDPDVVALLAQSAKIGLLLLGIISALGTLGINVAAMVAGLGLTGLALGLAVKDMLSNAMAGVLILIYKPFKRDDHVAVSSFQGRVTEVNLRYTTLEADGLRVFIPNTLLLTNAVVVGDGGKLVSTPSPLAPQGK
jgi:small conductance mechanosensitive channel